MQLESPPLLSVFGLRDKKSLRGLSLRVEAGEFACLLGETGSRLSDAVKLISGRGTPLGGDVFLKDRKITDDWPDRRKLCYVPEKPARLSIIRNNRALLTAYGFDASSLSREEQQVCLRILRALALRPEALVICVAADKLNGPLRAKVFQALKDAALSGTGILYATDDGEPVMAFADRVLLLSRGRIIQEGSPEELLEHPLSEKAALMCGGFILIRGQAAAVKGDKLLFSSDGLSIPCRSELWLTPGEPLTLCLRHRWLEWSKEADSSFSPPLRAKLLQADPCPAGHRLSFQLTNGLRFTLEREELPASRRQPGENYYVRWDMDKAILLRPDIEEKQ